MRTEKFILDDARQIQQWDDFVRSHPRGTPFHTSAWLEIIRKTYNYHPVLYAFINDSNEIEGIFPCFHVKSFITGNRLVSIPFSDYGGPLVLDGKVSCDDLLNALGSYRKGCNCFEVRCDLSPQLGFVFHNHYKCHVLELNSDPDRVLEKIDRRTTRYSIRKAKKSGIEIRPVNTLEGMKQFFRLNIMTRKKHGLPSQPWAFFKNIYTYLIEKHQAFLLLAFDSAKVISAGLFIKFRNTIFYKYNASDPDSLSKKSPNHLLTWHAIEEACQGGFRFFDFGRTATVNHGLTKYKELWGAQPVDLPYSYYPTIRTFKPSTENALQYRVFTEICRHVPDDWLTAFGAKIYRHIG